MNRFAGGSFSSQEPSPRPPATPPHPPHLSQPPPSFSSHVPQPRRLRPQPPPSFSSHGPPSRPPPPPPPPPTSCVSSSPLSPLAPPFRLDRSSYKNRLSSLASDAVHSQTSSAVPGSSDRFSSSYSSSLASLETSLNSISSLNSTSCTSVVESSPYYYPNTEFDFEGYPEGGVPSQPDFGFDGWNKPFDEDRGGWGEGYDGSWIDHSRVYSIGPPRQGVTAEGFVGFEDVSGVCRGKYADSLRRKVDFGPEFFEATYEGNARDPYKCGTSLVNSNTCNTVNSISSYDRSIPRLGLYSTNPIGYYTEISTSAPATIVSSSARIYAPSDRRTDSSMDKNMSKNEYSNVQHMDPYSIIDDCVEHMSTKRKEPSASRSAEGKFGYGEKSIDDNIMNENDGMFVDSSSIKKGFPSGNISPCGNPLDSSTEVESGLRITKLNIPNSSTFDCGSAELGASVQSSSEALDQLNLAVDSPCWKGAPTSRSPLFGVGETVCPLPLVNESKSCYGLDQGHKNLPISDAHSENLSSLHQDADQDKKDSSFSFLRESSSANSFQSRNKKFKDAKRTGLDCANVGNEKGTPSSVVLKEHEVTLKDLERDCEREDYNGTQSGQDRSAVSATRPILAGGIANSEKGNLPADIVEPVCSSGNAGTCSPQSIDIQLLVRAMNDLSELLLSAHNCDANELKEHDNELLLFVVDNLEAFIPKNKKWFGRNAGGFEEEELSGLLGDGLVGGKWRGPTRLLLLDEVFPESVEELLKAIKEGVDNDKFDDYVSKDGDPDFEKVNGIAQALEKVTEENLLEKEENDQAILYRNLWIEAEVALCSMKYELARMKIEMENQKKHKAKGKLTQASNLNSLHELDRHYASPFKVEESLHYSTSTLGDVAGTSCYIKTDKALPLITNMADEVDDSVMARFRVLKARGEQKLRASFNVGESQDTGVHLGMKETLCSSILDTEKNLTPKQFLSLQHQPIKHADLGFIGKSEQPGAQPFKPRASLDVGESQDIGVHLGTKETPHSSILDTEKNIRLEQFLSLEHQTKKLADLGFTGKIEQPGAQPFKPRDGRQHLGGNDDEIVLGSSISEHATTTEFHAGTTDGSVNESYIRTMKGGKFVDGGYDSPSSEWEHVLKEELTW